MTEYEELREKIVEVIESQWDLREPENREEEIRQERQLADKILSIIAERCWLKDEESLEPTGESWERFYWDAGWRPVKELKKEEIEWKGKETESSEISTRSMGIREMINGAKVVCLCGSTRFTEDMLIKQWELTKQGIVVLSWCALPKWYFSGEDNAHIGDQEGVKEIIDEVHFRKIDLADEVFVINIGGYIGESTSKEIAYAKSLNKPINYFVEVAFLKGIDKEE